MCLNDWRIGRLIKSVHSVKSPAIADSLHIRANPNRVGITWWESPDMAIGAARLDIFQGSEFLFSMGGGMASITISLTTHGDLPTKEFQMSAQTLPLDFYSYTEYFLTEDILSVGLDEFRSKYRP